MNKELEIILEILYNLQVISQASKEISFIMINFIDKFVVIFLEYVKNLNESNKRSVHMPNKCP